jgi:hypothetical protein
MPNKKLVAWRGMYIRQILEGRKTLKGVAGMLPYIHGFDEYNKIIQINSVFSNNPNCIPVDRTLSTLLPFKYYIPREWKVPTQKWTLDYAMEQRVIKLLQREQKINIMWSGGIDSTALLTAFLKHTTNLDQLRVMYSPWSTYEHPEYLDFLKKFNGIELVDFSGTTYLDSKFDGIFVLGDGGDELLASVDESFIDAYGINSLHTSWIDFFYAKTSDSALIEFCQKHFTLAGRPIETVLQARWWFYTCFKSRSVLSNKVNLLFDRSHIDINDLQGFYDCNEFENYIYWNIEDCIQDSYSTWKKILKDYAYKFDGLSSWHKNKIKHSSSQVDYYWAKKDALTNQRWVALDSDGIVYSTPSLPILTMKEFNKYTNLEWAFN